MSVDNSFWPYWVKSRGDKALLVFAWVVIVLGAALLASLPFRWWA